jgi:Avidin family
LKGALHYPLVSFLVDFSESEFTCAWVGRFHEVKKGDDTTELVLGTLWLLGNLYQGEGDNLKATKFWNTFQINQDVFRRIKSAKIRTLNDRFRKSLTGGRVMMTAAVSALPDDVTARARSKV